VLTDRRHDRGDLIIRAITKKYQLRGHGCKKVGNQKRGKNSHGVSVPPGIKETSSILNTKGGFPCKKEKTNSPSTRQIRVTKEEINRSYERKGENRENNRPRQSEASH